jgi:hypothetical protein
LHHDHYKKERLNDETQTITGSNSGAARCEEETKTKGGIIIPDTAKEKPAEGKVIAVGNGKLGDDGKHGPGVKKATEFFSASTAAPKSRLTAKNT